MEPDKKAILPDINRQDHTVINGIQPEKSLAKKLEILSDAAKYDVACTSSGVDRAGKKGYLGNSCAAGVCHSFAADGRCISLLKILMTNHCIYDCRYCKNRKSNDVERATFSPQEICTLTIEFYKRNYIEGLFLSSGILKNPDYTMEKIVETLRLLRGEYRFNGYIHVKAIPGASRELLYSAGLLADRISINMELPTQDSLKKLAPNKQMANIIRPMNQISGTIAMHRLSAGRAARMERAGINDYLIHSIWGYPRQEIDAQSGVGQPGTSGYLTGRVSDNTFDHAANYAINHATNYATNHATNHVANYAANHVYNHATDSPYDLPVGIKAEDEHFLFPADKKDLHMGRSFAPAGPSTQMIIGATDETDLELIRTTQSLYRSFDLKRVFYSGYIPVNEDAMLPAIGTPVPLLREHRLYQADWLLRYYGFFADELLSEEHPFFDDAIDPKCNWALNHLEEFPVEINTASCEKLLRVPGIGPTGAKKILNARRYRSIDFEMLKKMRITLKRAQYFITCNGKMLYHTPIEHRFIRNRLIDVEDVSTAQIGETAVQFQQMNLFTDYHVS